MLGNPSRIPRCTEKSKKTRKVITTKKTTTPVFPAVDRKQQKQIPIPAAFKVWFVFILWESNLVTHELEYWELPSWPFPEFFYVKKFVQYVQVRHYYFCWNQIYYMFLFLFSVVRVSNNTWNQLGWEYCSQYRLVMFAFSLIRFLSDSRRILNLIS